MGSKETHLEALEEKDDKGNTRIHVAAINNERSILKFLVSTGGNVDEKNKKGRTVLHHAIKQCDLDVVKILIDAGADLSTKDTFGGTLLHEAVQNKNAEITKLLLDAGADANALNEFKLSPLHYAVIYQNKPAVSLLLSAGADVRIKNVQGNTPLQVGFHDTDTCDLDMVKVLVGAGADAKCKTCDGRTLVHLAAEQNNFQVIEYLLSLGVGVDDRDELGETALHLAVKNYFRDCCFMLTVDVLLKNGADVEVVNNEGQSPKQIFEKTKSGNAKVIELFSKSRDHEE